MRTCKRPVSQRDVQQKMEIAHYGHWGKHLSLSASDGFAINNKDVFVLIALRMF